MLYYIRYLSYVFRHKWFVMIECFKRGIYRRGIMHDMSKLLPSEMIPYAHFFSRDKKGQRDETGYYKPTDTGDKAFDYAWLLHQKRNKHHWQWWVLPEDEGGLKILEMPDEYRKEMLSDWYGAGKALGTPDVNKWYSANKHKMRLHPKTRAWIEEQLRLSQSRRK